MEHHFNVDLAKKYGVPVAIILNHLAFWISKNRANNKHFHDGRYWSHNSIRAFQELFPYWTSKQMRTVLDKVKECEYIVLGNFNKLKYDQTTWYSLSDDGLKWFNIPIGPFGQMEETKWANRKAQNGQPIPDNNPDNNPDIKSSCSSNNQKKYNNKEKTNISSVEKQSNTYNPELMNRVVPISPLLASFESNKKGNK